MARNEIPRWMTQPTPSIGEAAANRIRVVTPDDLQAASQMYGELSQSMFQVAHTNALGLQYHRPDITQMKSYDNYLTASKALQQLRTDPEASKSGVDYSKKADPIIKDAVKGMGFFEGRIMQNILQGEKYHTAVHLDTDMVNKEIASSFKFKEEEWNNKQKKYLSQVDSKWTTEQRNQFIQTVKDDQRKTLHFISEGQHTLYDGEFAKDYEAAAVMNDVIRDNKFIKVKERNEWLASDALEKIFADPDLKARATRVLKNGLEMYNGAEGFSDSIKEYAVQSAFGSFRNKFDNEPNEVKRRALWKQELLKSNDYDPKYKRMVKQLGDAPGWNSRSTGYGGSSASNDEWKRKAMNGEVEPSEAAALFQNNKITGKQYAAYQTGLRYRKKEYEGLDRDFNARIKSDFGFAITPPKGKNAEFLAQFAPKNPDEIELKNFILERKAALMEQGLKADAYQKGLQEINMAAKQKKTEQMQRSQTVYGGQGKSDKLTSVYGTK